MWDEDLHSSSVTSQFDRMKSMRQAFHEITAPPPRQNGCRPDMILNMGGVGPLWHTRAIL